MDDANKYLKCGDVCAYWKSLEAISPIYARIAGQGAGNEGPIGTGARGRLQIVAEEARDGRRFMPTSSAMARSTGPRPGA
ncbi:MAG: hypothetical protein VW268_07735 [Rhodospirillaceae bacterium]